MEQMLPELMDPITYELFRDPVIASDGHTYERSSIVRWWERCVRAGNPRTSPVTREAMTDNLVENPVVKRMAEKYLAYAIPKRPRVEGPRTADCNDESTTPLSELAAELSDALAALDTVKECLEVTPDRPPLFVFLGSENSGKSTLIERLAATQLFPADTDRSTRMIVKICLRRAGAAMPRLVLCNARTGIVKSAVDVPPEDLAAAIQTMMQTEVQREHPTEANGVCQHSSLTVHIKSPTLLDLDIVELPGINDDATAKLAERYLEDVAGHARYVVTIPAHTAAPDETAAFQLVQRRQLTSSTILVFTKADLADFQAQASAWGKMWERLMPSADAGVAADEVPIAYAVTMNGCFAGHESTASSFFEQVQQQAARESHWFQQEGARFGLFRSSALSCTALVAWMADRYRQHYASASWVQELLTELETKHTRLSEDDEELGQPVASDVQSIDVDALRSAANKTLSDMELAPLMQAIDEQLRDNDSQWTGEAEWSGTVKSYRSWMNNAYWDHAYFLHEQLAACESIVCEHISRMLSEDRSEFKFGRFENVLPVLRAALPDLANAWRRQIMQNVTPVLQQFYEREHGADVLSDFSGSVPKVTVKYDLELVHNKVILTAMGFTEHVLTELARHLPVEPHYWLEDCAQRRAAVQQQLEDVERQISAVRSLTQPATVATNIEAAEQPRAAELSSEEGAAEESAADALDREELADQVAALMSDDVQRAIAAAEYIRDFTGDCDYDKLSQKVQPVIDAGVVPHAVELLHRNDQPALQEHACSVLLNIAAGTAEQARAVVEAGAVPTLMQLLGNERLQIQAAWTLSNIAAHGEHCSLAVHHGLVPALLLCTTSWPSNLMTKVVARTIFSVSRDCGCIESVKPALPWLASTAASSDAQVLQYVCPTLGRLAAHSDIYAQSLLETGVAPRLLQLLSHPLSSIRDAALRTIENISSHAECVQTITWLGASQLLKQSLADPGPTTRQRACGALGNIMQHGAEHVKAILDASTFDRLVSLLSNAKVDLARAALGAINAAVASDVETVWESSQRRRLIETLCDLLPTPDKDLRDAVLTCFHCLLNEAASKFGAEPALATAHEFGLAAKLIQLSDDGQHDVRVAELLSLLRREDDVETTRA